MDKTVLRSCVLSVYTRPTTSNASPSKLNLAIVLDIVGIMLHCHNLHILHFEYEEYPAQFFF